MKYDFDLLTERRGTASLKWSAEEGELPMWVADMDFAAAPPITAAIQKRVQSGIFGYSIVPGGWNTAICAWWQKRHGLELSPEWLVFCTGVVPAISSVVRKMTKAGESVLVQTPVYNIFFNSITNNGRRILENRLKYSGGEYHIDFEDLERKLADPQTTLMLICNPHNPIGRIWDRDTLDKISELCWKHHVLVVSDEIHCDLTDPGFAYLPFAGVSEHAAQNSITCISPSKAFNLAGLQTAAVIVPNENLRRQVERALNTDEVAEPNAFAVDAAIAAFTQGEEWLDALREYLLENKRVASDFLKTELPQIGLTPAHATYLLWLDCGSITGNSVELAAFIRKNSGLWLSDGHSYGENGKQFLRMNIACPRARLKDGLRRLKQGVTAYNQLSLSHLG